MEDMKEKIIFCRGGGCTAKLGAGALSSVLAKLPKKRDENLLVGFDSSDDAAVYRLNEDLAMIYRLWTSFLLWWKILIRSGRSRRRML